MARRSPQPPASAQQTVHLQQTTCVLCGVTLHVAHHTQRTIRRLDGVWRLTMPLMRSLDPQCLRDHSLVSSRRGRGVGLAAWGIWL